MDKLGLPKQSKYMPRETRGVEMNQTAFDSVLTCTVGKLFV
jgi:hypothetical protein